MEDSGKIGIIDIAEEHHRDEDLEAEPIYRLEAAPRDKIDAVQEISQHHKQDQGSYGVEA